MNSSSLRLLAVAAWSLSTVSCGGTMFQKNDLADTLRKAGWIVLPIPSDTTGPGTVIYFPDEAKSPSFLQNLSKCGVPENLMTVSAPKDAPEIKTDRSYDYDVKASLATLPAKAAASLSGSKKASVQIASQGAEELNQLGDIDNWRQNPDHSGLFAPNCRKYFDSESKGYYLVYAAWRITEGTYTFYSDNKGSLTVDTSQVPKGGSASASIEASGSKDGTVTFKSKTYIAIRKVVPTAGGLRWAGGPQQLDSSQFADERLKKAFAQ